MSVKSSAHYQREYRRRLREQGLVKKEVWIRPEHARQLAALEKRLRDPHETGDVEGVRDMTEKAESWTTQGLLDALAAAEPFANGDASVELIDGVEPALHMVMGDFGDLPLFLTVSGEQIIVEGLLWSAADVADAAAFNEAVLRTHKYFPLSTISLDRAGDGSDYYYMFGALSSASVLKEVLFEIDTLARNVIQAIEAYGEFLVSGEAGEG